MNRRSGVGAGVALKLFHRLAKHPWIGSKLLKLQLEKYFFTLANPLATDGMAGRIHQVSIRITDICNLRCHTCGQWGDSGFLHGMDLKELKKREIPPERYMEVFTDLVRQGHHPNVYFWGGEPMLYDGILDLIEGATKLRLPVSIATNGTRLTASAERLAAAPMFLLQVSIDGHDEETHNRARPSAGRGNSFKDIREGLAAVREERRRRGSDLPLIASLTTISASNYRHLADIYETFRDSVDLCIFYPSWWIDETSAGDHERDFSRRFGFAPVKHRGWIGGWRPDDFQVLYDQIKILQRLSRPLSAPPVSIIPPIVAPGDIETYYTDHAATFGFNQCVSIFQVVEINSNGDLSPCRDYHDFVVGNIRHRTIVQLWNSPRYRQFRRSLHTEGLMPVCSRCCGLMGY